MVKVLFAIEFSVSASSTSTWKPPEPQEESGADWYLAPPTAIVLRSFASVPGSTEVSNATRPAGVKA